MRTANRVVVASLISMVALFIGCGKDNGTDGSVQPGADMSHVTGSADMATGNGPDMAGMPPGPDMAMSNPMTAMVMVGPNGMFVFTPNPVVIHAGDTVKWTWASGGHTVTSGTAPTADNKFCSPSNTNCSSSPTSAAGFTYSHTFPAAGSFPYFCIPHAAAGMTGTVTVQ